MQDTDRVTSESATPGSAPRSKRAEFAWFAGGVGSWFGAWGLQQVLFSWIVVGELQADSEWVGICQTSTMLPALLLLLAGGAVADRVDPRRLLVGLHLLAAIPVLGLAAASAFGWISLGVLIAYGLCIGTLQAFVMPARDTLLSRVAGDDMMNAVTSMTATQFGCQAAGALLARVAHWTGSATMLCVQAGVLMLGAGSTLGAPRDSAARVRSGRGFTLKELVRGVVLVAGNERLRQPVILVISVGILFVGPFMVIFPLLVRDYYHAGVETLSTILMLFPLGTIIGSIVLRIRGIRRKGRAALIALAVGAGTQVTMGLGVPLGAMIALTLLWGLAGSVFINCSRTLYQEAAPLEERGRVLAVYNIGFMGGAPIGALLSGFASGLFGIHGALVGAALGMLTIVTTMTLATQLSRME